MILSASRRTDIPAFYGPWLLSRLAEGFALMPNPRNPDRLGRVTLSPELVDCIVFWTKNPEPMLPLLGQIERLGYDYYFHFTLTPYGPAMEQGLPPKERLLDTFRELSERLGPRRVIWRYDPVIIDPRHTVSWHLERFQAYCESLAPFTERCIISFIDAYPGPAKGFRPMTVPEMEAIAAGFAPIAKAHGLSLFTCAEEIGLEAHGIQHAACIDLALIEEIIGHSLTGKKDPNQRPACGCVQSVDIGAYESCAHGCAYCYGIRNHAAARYQVRQHDPAAPMVTGYPGGTETVTDRTLPSHKTGQIRMW